MDNSLIWAYFLVFVLSAIPFFEAIAIVPVAIVGGLSPVPVIILGMVGNLLTVYLVIVFIDYIKKWRKSKKDEQEKENKRSIRARKIWKKYGLPGLAIIGPLFVGSHLTALMGVTFGGTKKATAVWMTVSLGVWCMMLALLAYFGFDFMHVEGNGFIKDLFQN